MKICLVTAFPPSGRQLNEYALHIAQELQRNPMINLTVLGDELSDYQFATDASGHAIRVEDLTELPEFDVTRCWKFNHVSAMPSLLREIRRLQPDVVWF